MTPVSCPVVIFCGGRGTRFGAVPEGPKTLLPTPKVPLLWRLLGQIEAAGMEQVIVATTPRFAAVLSESASRYGGSIDASVFVSEAQREGLLPGLGDVLATDAFVDRCVLCLGDIYFLENPFFACSETLTTGESALIVAPRSEAGELHQGGLVIHRDRLVTRVAERPMEPPRDGVARWTGAALVDVPTTRADLESFLEAGATDAPEGELFQYQIERGRRFSVVIGSDFVNVNTPEEWLLASLYDLRGSAPGDGAVTIALESAARTLRAGLAERRE